AFLRVIGKEPGARIFREIALEFRARLLGQLPMRDHERKRFVADQRVRAIEAGGVEQGCGKHDQGLLALCQADRVASAAGARRGARRSAMVIPWSRCAPKYG